MHKYSTFMQFFSFDKWLFRCYNAPVLLIGEHNLAQNALKKLKGDYPNEQEEQPQGLHHGGTGYRYCSYRYPGYRPDPHFL